MTDIVYKPLNEAPPQSDTKLPKLDFYNALLQYGTRIIKDVSEAGTPLSTHLIYTVPAGKIFFLFHAQISVVSSNDDGFGIMQIKNGTLAFGLLDCNIQDAPQISGYMVATFAPAIPVRMMGGEFIELLNNGIGVETTGTIFGYEVDSALLPNFI